MMLALVIGLVISVASFKLWAWLTQAIVEENQCYQKTRVEAANARGGPFYNNPGLGARAVTRFDDAGATGYSTPTQPPPHGNPFWNQPPQLRIFRDGYELGNRCR